MALKVIQWATGGVGRDAIRHILADPELELAGVYVYSDSKNGVDAGELVGVDPIGVRATTDRDAIMALDADCVLHAPLIMTDHPVVSENDDDVDDLLRSGKNVISVAGYLSPAARSSEVEERFEKACQAGAATLYGTGMNPGVLLTQIGPAVSGLCERFDHITLRETWDASSYPSPELLFEMVGFGKPDGWLTNDSPAGVMLAGWFNEALSAFVHLMGKDVERFERSCEYGLATQDTTISVGTIPKGTIGAVGWTWTAVVDGKPFASINDRWVADWDIPGWSGNREHYWEVMVAGAPSLDIRFGFRDTFPALAEGQIATDRIVSGSTASVAVNAIPAVCQAPPGILRTPPITPCRVFGAS